MGDQNGLPEYLRQFMSGRNHELTTNNPHLPDPQLSVNGYDHIMAVEVFSRGLSQFTHDHDHNHHHHHPTTNTAATISMASADHNSTAFCSSIENSAEKGWLGFEGGNNRWPRQETLSLLEIRSRLDPKFRDTNHKGPLWNEVSRIMGEEYGYRRSGKKCKEKFENLYKYYKKTKNCKANGQDGKHYRFFHQLEEICGERTTYRCHPSTSETHHATNTTSSPYNQTPSFMKTIHQQQDGEVLIHNLNNSDHHSLSFSNSSEFETSSSENNGNMDLSAIACMMKQKQKQKGVDQRQRCGRVRRSWRGMVEELVDSNMRKIMETQDAWMEKILSVIEQRDQEMPSKEVEREEKESTEVVKKHIEKGLEELPLAEPMAEEEQAKNKNKSLQSYEAKEFFGPCEADDYRRRWTEMEISNLIQLRTGLELRFQQSGCLENGLWDEIAAKMASLGFDHRTAIEYKQIWNEISQQHNGVCSTKTKPLWTYS